MKEIIIITLVSLLSAIFYSLRSITIAKGDYKKGGVLTIFVNLTFYLALNVGDDVIAFVVGNLLGYIIAIYITIKSNEKRPYTALYRFVLLDNTQLTSVIEHLGMSDFDCLINDIRLVIKGELVETQELEIATKNKKRSQELEQVMSAFDITMSRITLNKVGLR